MAKHPLKAKSGRTYVCHVPELSVVEARARLKLISDHNAGQVLLENRARLIDRKFNEVADKDDIGKDIDAALTRLDNLSERSRAAMAELSEYANKKLMIEFVCDRIEGASPELDLPWTELPVADANDLYRICRAIMIGVDPNPPDQAT